VNVSTARLAGYAHLLQHYGISAPELFHRSSIADVSSRSTVSIRAAVEETFPASYAPGDDDLDHLVFALKYDGIDLGVLKAIFAELDHGKLVHRIQRQPTSKYARRIFFLFEWLTGERLAIPDLTQGAYTPVLEPSDYFVSAGRRSARHRVIDNLLGDAGFCPVVRRTSVLKVAGTKPLGDRAREITGAVEPRLLARAVSWLYTKETKSSFAIEHEEPGDRMERFVALLAAVGSRPLDDEASLTELQRAFVDPRYAEPGFRQAGDREVYVGETIGFHEWIHHVGARSSSTPELMAAWARMRQVEGHGGVVVEAACRSFSFVFIHPFGDGNGRIHRLLLHNILARRDYLPPRLIVPISAVLYEDAHGYDRALESFSARILPFVARTLGDYGELRIDNDTDDLYRYPDLTTVCEATFGWLERAIEVELPAELEFLRRYDEVRERMREVVEMPDKKEQLFIKLCVGNGGRLSARKRSRFAELDDATVAALEAIVADMRPADAV
jgi:hypothetical protein